MGIALPGLELILKLNLTKNEMLYFSAKSLLDIFVTLDCAAVTHTLPARDLE